MIYQLKDVKAPWFTERRPFTEVSFFLQDYAEKGTRGREPLILTVLNSSSNFTMEMWSVPKKGNPRHKPLDVIRWVEP